jgi:hypothetical protein
MVNEPTEQQDQGYIHHDASDPQTGHQQAGVFQ